MTIRFNQTSQFSTSSTNPLINLFENQEKLNEVLLQLQTSVGFSNCVIDADEIKGRWSEPDGLSWKFIFKADVNKGALVVLNDGPLALSRGEDDTDYASCEYIRARDLVGKQSSIITSILIKEIKNNAYKAYCLAFGKANDINETQLIEKIKALASENEYPPRTQFLAEILGLPRANRVRDPQFGLRTYLDPINRHINNVPDEHSPDLQSLLDRLRSLEITHSTSGPGYTVPPGGFRGRLTLSYLEAFTRQAQLRQTSSSTSSTTASVNTDLAQPFQAMEIVEMDFEEAPVNNNNRPR